jgi:hypothetical protein
MDGIIDQLNRVSGVDSLFSASFSLCSRRRSMASGDVNELSKENSSRQ